MKINTKDYKSFIKSLIDGIQLEDGTSLKLSQWDMAHIQDFGISHQDDLYTTRTVRTVVSELYKFKLNFDVEIPYKNPILIPKK